MMKEDEIYEMLTEVFVDVFDLDELDLSPQTSAQDIEEWDSMSNIQMLVAVERALNIRFSTVEVSGNRNVGEFVQMILSKLNS
ncbi:acyl carrier protein [Magnetococcus sp. PR-3]|uniref:acyl carrier protein n=1 Tax=Magnetococcus sp. PR-3 TaxID=3120355 RepID=UPI002FCE21F1